METTSIEMSAATLRNTTNTRLCPECGRIMTETDRLRENGSLYIWYKCTGNYCDGTWLSEIPFRLSRSRTILDE